MGKVKTVRRAFLCSLRMRALNPRHVHFHAQMMPGRGWPATRSAMGQGQAGRQGAGQSRWVGMWVRWGAGAKSHLPHADKAIVREALDHRHMRVPDVLREPAVHQPHGVQHGQAAWSLTSPQEPWAKRISLSHQSRARGSENERSSRTCKCRMSARCARAGPLKPQALPRRHSGRNTLDGSRKTGFSSCGS